jgi:hypothetical protein
MPVLLGTQLIGFRMPQVIQIQPLVDLDEILHHRSTDLGASATTACPAKEEQGAVAHANQAIGAGSEHRFERVFGQRSFARGAHAPRGIRAAHPAQEFLNRRIPRGIRKILDLMGFGQHREPVHDGIERQRTGGAFKTAFDQHSVEGRRQLTLQRSLGRGALDVVDDELNERGHWHWQA